ncbi:hypothetical protein PINS_up004663 [Pythium insidiosum]|nr:hypothetical protein PINS_up004663 [Pythium insidiosum]
MRTCGERLPQIPPVDYVQGLGGQQLRVEGLWRFSLRTVYNQVIELDALLVEGCDEEILLGKDFLVEKRARIDFDTNEARYVENEDEIILPFSVSTVISPAAVRMVRGQKLATQTYTTFRVPVTAADGTVGVFEPAIAPGVATGAKDSGYGARRPRHGASFERIGENNQVAGEKAARLLDPPRRGHADLREAWRSGA